MLKSMSSGVSGLRSHQTMLDVIANNVANVNTVGFKSSRVVFTDVYYQTLSAANGATATSGGTNASQIGSGMTISTIDLLNTQGGFSQTDKLTDLYISGEGYFIVRDSAGATKYTRVGNLKFDDQGNLTDANGNFIMGENGTPSLTFDPANPTAIALSALAPIKVALGSNSSIAIGSNGTITGVDNTGAVQTLGRIFMASFANPDGLSQEGSLYMGATGSSGAPMISNPGSTIAGKLIAGNLEQSNVDLSQQLTNMIIAERGFHANSRVITTSDEILQDLVNLKR